MLINIFRRRTTYSPPLRLRAFPSHAPGPHRRPTPALRDRPRQLPRHLHPARRPGRAHSAAPTPLKLFRFPNFRRNPRLLSFFYRISQNPKTRGVAHCQQEPTRTHYFRGWSHRKHDRCALARHWDSPRDNQPRRPRAHALDSTEDPVGAISASRSEERFRLRRNQLFGFV